MLIPSIGSFFTPLHLEAAFVYQDQHRAISSRRFVAPSFNDVRLILNTAQIMALLRPTSQPNPAKLIANASNPLMEAIPSPTLQLLTFDGDVTLYDDGASLTPTNPVIPRLLHFLSRNIRIGIVTAAGYTDASKYYLRLHGLLDAIASSTALTTPQKHNLLVMGGESNFLFVFDETSPHRLRYIHRRDWILPLMHTWSEAAIQSLLTIAEDAFKSCIAALNLPAEILRKERAVGIFPRANHRFSREQLEETVLVVQQVVEMAPQVREAGIPFCAFNGGNDVFVDIGDKSLGVQGCQKWFGGVSADATLHVGDQFLSGGGNDFKARLACTTAWIASPEETVALLDEMIALEGSCRREYSN
jgi:IMP and pyridine-specific 5'-nucleotidase